MTTKEPDIANMLMGNIIQKYSGMIYKLAYTRTKNRADAEDLLQEVVLRCLKSNKRFNSEEHCKAWLIRVTVNTSKNLLASAWRKRMVLMGDSRRISSEKNNNISWDNKSKLFCTVMKLPEKYRIVIHLYYYEDYSIAEIGKILNRKESTVKTRLFRARKLLKKNLKGVYYYELERV